jgi:hypothetical protein
VYSFPLFAITVGRILLLTIYFLFFIFLGMALMAAIDRLGLPFWVLAAWPVAYLGIYMFVIVPRWQGQDRKLSRKHMREKREERK